jgi:hypothetical protein
MTTEIEFNDLMFNALDHGIASIKENAAPLIPFVLYQNRTGERELRRFITETLEQGLAEARNHILSKNLNINAYAIVWDGYITIDNRKWDAILVEAGSSESEDGFLLAQRYETKGLLKKKNSPVGNPVQIGKPKSAIFRASH